MDPSGTGTSDGLSLMVDMGTRIGEERAYTLACNSPSARDGLRAPKQSAR